MLVSRTDTGPLCVRSILLERNERRKLVLFPFGESGVNRKRVFATSALCFGLFAKEKKGTRAQACEGVQTLRWWRLHEHGVRMVELRGLTKTDCNQPAAAPAIG